MAALGTPHHAVAPPLPLNDRLIHLRVSTVAWRLKFREELSRPWAQPKLRWIPVGDPPTRQRERVLVGQHHQQEMEEDDDSTPDPR